MAQGAGTQQGIDYDSVSGTKTKPVVSKRLMASVLAQFDSAVLEAVGRASKRSADVVREELKDGLYDLATIASIAPWIGIFGTIVGIVNSFEGISGPRWTIVAVIFGGFAEALWLTAFGLFVGLVALWSFRYLDENLRTFDLEMENASLDSLNQLGRFPKRFAIEPVSELRAADPMFGELPLEIVQREETFFRRCLVLACTVLTLEWLVQAARFFLINSLEWRSAALNAWISVPTTFALSCVFVYPFWTRLLARRPGALVAAAAVLALGWSVAEFLLGRSFP